ncbi:MAG: GmrSD restriction endonuclease domain-containing protein [Phocaeicola sp.]
MPKTIFSESLTPQKVSKTHTIYSIPIYQRLFEWDEPRIIQLLDDLYQAYENGSNQPYYIGMLTSNNNYDLIDGQQRFTVMMLLGIVMSQYYSNWDSFIFADCSTRLKFKARTDDNIFLSNRCIQNSVSTYENLYMKRGIKCIQDYIDKKIEKENDSASCTIAHEFSRYVFEHMNFFISFLPNDYFPIALNKYFETMNSTGKNLENHEILKVKMLREASRFDKEKLSRLWNAVSDMDKHLVRRKRKEEKQYEIVKRHNNAYTSISNSNLESLFSNAYANDLSTNKHEVANQHPSIGTIEANLGKPVKQRLSRKNGFHSILSFSEFLLQVLWLNLDKKRQEGVGVKNFFDVNKLQETFLSYWNCIDADNFILSLFKYRLLYDKYVINVSNEESTYDIELNNDTSDKKGNTYRDILIMYQSMLYVNSSSASYYLWIPALLAFAETNMKKCEELYHYIKTEDEKRHPISVIDSENSLSFNKVDRYWFWKLDFYIWLNRKNLFQDESVYTVADNYTFRRNRSVEHIAPQTPEQDSTLRLSDRTENCFGNLAMISSSQNSSLQNSTFEVKRAKVLSYIHKELGGSIESLKMLMIYQYNTWNEENIFKHQESCIQYLKLSFE